MTLCQLILREMTLMTCFIETKYKICDKMTHICCGIKFVITIIENKNIKSIKL